MKHILFLVLLLLPVAAAKAQSGCSATDSTKALQWLRLHLDKYFRDSVTMQEITTVRYAAFKTDAMNHSMNGGLSENAFKKKWRRHYDITQPGIAEGFLVPLQDWNEIRVQCRFLSSGPQGYWIEAVMTEHPSGISTRKKILLQCIENSYRIADVLPLE